MKLKRLIDHIVQNGPVELSAALKTLDMREAHTRTHQALLAYMQEVGGIRYDTGKKTWAASLCQKTEARSPYVWRDLKWNLYANAALRPGAMDYRTIPSVWG